MRTVETDMTLENVTRVVLEGALDFDIVLSLDCDVVSIGDGVFVLEAEIVLVDVTDTLAEIVLRALALAETSGERDVVTLEHTVDVNEN